MLKTTIVKPGYLDVGLEVITDCEHHEKEGKEWWYIYSMWEGYMGFAEDIRVQSEKFYLEGNVKGINQTIKLEIPTIESVEEVLPLYHEIMEKHVEALKDQLKIMVLAKLGESLYG